MVAAYPFALAGLLYEALAVVWTHRRFGQRAFVRQVLLQIYFTGVEAAPPVIMLALAVGGIATLEGIGGAAALSGAESLGRVLAVVVLRDIAPLLTGSIVIVRSVTAITAQLGVMKVQREIEAVELMGLSPTRLLVTPRLLGGLFAFFGLNVIFNAVALAGGLLVGDLVLSIPPHLLLSATLSAVEPGHLVAFALKIGLGGAGIFLVACHHGMAVKRASTQIPIAVANASLNAFILLLVVHGAISVGSILQTVSDLQLSLVPL